MRLPAVGCCGAGSFEPGWIPDPPNMDLLAVDPGFSAVLSSFKDLHRGHCPVLPSGHLWSHPVSVYIQQIGARSD